MAGFDHELDARDESCPMPVMQTKKLLKNMTGGEVLHVMATDPASEQDIDILLSALEDELIESNVENGVYHFYIRKS